ncbi:hypothetical protein U1Q18_040210 [Sarracenia purpurea var. burkii]
MLGPGNSGVLLEDLMEALNYLWPLGTHRCYVVIRNRISLDIEAIPLLALITVVGMNAKGASSFVLEGRSGYGSTMPDSTKHTTGDYTLPSSHGYGRKSDQLFFEKISDYPSVDGHQYGERQSAYVGRDLHHVYTS